MLVIDLKRKLWAPETKVKKNRYFFFICDLLQDSDPDLEQFLAFKQHLDAGSSIHKKWLTNEKARKTKQERSLFF